MTRAEVRVAGESVGRIDGGLLVLVGVGPADSRLDAERLALKVAQLRIFPDEEGRFNRSVQDCGGSCLVVSQFTLYADNRRGRRPSFTGAADPALGESLYLEFARQLSGLGVPTATGRFGAKMEVELINDGPVTISLATDAWDCAIT